MYGHIHDHLKITMSGIIDYHTSPLCIEQAFVSAALATVLCGVVECEDTGGDRLSLGLTGNDSSHYCQVYICRYHSHSHFESGDSVALFGELRTSDNDSEMD